MSNPQAKHSKATRNWLESLTDEELLKLRNRKHSAAKVAVILVVSFAAGLFIGVCGL